MLTDEERLNRAKAEQEKSNERIAKLEAKIKHQESLGDMAAKFVLSHPEVYWVTKLDRFLIRNGNGWIYAKSKAFETTYSEFTIKGFKQAFLCAMDAAGRNFLDVTYSFEQEPHKLNLLRRDHWVQPKEGNCHWFFDVLMQSLGGGKAENIEHIERCIIYKYQHPGDPRLPTLLIHGEGGLGKNLLEERVLFEIFAHAALSSTAKNIIGDFNSLLEGKVCALIDESKAGDVDHGKLKNMLGSNVLTINPKGVQQYQVPNIVWTIISSNKHQGGIWLDRSEADRRYSVIYAEPGKTLNYWIAQTLNCSIDEAREWVMANADAITTDHEQLGHWLYHLQQKYGDLDRPAALHGEDFRRLMRIQKPLHESLIEAVFTSPEFTHVDRRTLYQGYRILCREEGTKQLGKQRFFDAVAMFLTNNPKIGVPAVIQQRQQPDNHHAYLWIKDGMDRQSNYTNDFKYLSGEGYAREWVGPEVM